MSRSLWVVALMCVVWACGDRTDPPAGGAANAAPPAGVRWELVTMGGSAPARPVTLELGTDGCMTVKGMINRHSGPFVAQDGGLSLTVTQRTLAGGEEALQGPEARLIAAVAGVARYRVEDSLLTVTGTGEELVFKRSADTTPIPPGRPFPRSR